MQQDNNIVKICVVNEAEDILVEVIITTRLVNFWLQALSAMQADISVRDAEKRAGGGRQQPVPGHRWSSRVNRYQQMRLTPGYPEITHC